MKVVFPLKPVREAGDFQLRSMVPCLGLPNRLLHPLRRQRCQKLETSRPLRLSGRSALKARGAHSRLEVEPFMRLTKRRVRK